MDSSISTNLLKEICQKPPLVIEAKTGGYVLQENALPKPLNSSSWSVTIIALMFLLIFSWFFAILAIIFALVLIFNVQVRRTTWNNFWTAVCLTPGELTFSHYPLTLGDDDRLTFCRRLQSNLWTKWWQVSTLPAPATLTAQLLCVERVSYTQGTDTIIETAIINKTLLHSQTFPQGTTEMVSHFDLTIPQHLPPSFEGKNNQIRWVVVVQQTLTNLLEPLQSTFTLTIYDD